MKKLLKINWLCALALMSGLLGAVADDTRDQSAPDVQLTEAATAAPDAEEIEPAEGSNSVPVSTSHAVVKTRRHGREQEALVSFGKSALLRSNETADVVVVLGGNAKVQGKVREAVVAVFGDVEIDGADVGQECVAVFGNVKVGPGSVVHGEVVSVGGVIDVDENATVEGEQQSVGMALPDLGWLRDWFVHCVLKFRPLAPQVGWVWIVAGAFFLFYLLIAVALPRPVQACVDEITRRPATTFFMALLTKLLLPVVIVVLAATGIGILVIPFLLAALFFGALIGKVAFLEYLGQSLGRLFGVTIIKPVLGLIIGSVLLALLYMVPVLGLVVFAVSGLWGLGAAVTAGFGSLKRESADRSSNGGAAGTASAAVPMPAPLSAPIAPVGDPAMSASAGEGFFAGTTPVPPPSVGPAVSEAYTQPRASFWERLGAAFLDMVLAGILCGFVGGPPLGFLVILAYFAGMWAWKGTTVGGIVVNLKVVRLDGQPVTLPVALVRGLGGAFSAVVLFLGFFWILWDKDRQGWHDKIAGTVVVRVPRGRSLV